MQREREGRETDRKKDRQREGEGGEREKEQKGRVGKKCFFLIL